MKLYWPSLFAVLCACGSSDSGDSGGSTGGSESTGATAATMTATASMSDTLDSMSASMSDVTTMSTSLTTDATETTLADSSGTADTGSSGSGDTGSTGQGSDSGSTGGGAGVFDQCAMDDPQCAEGQECAEVMMGDYTFCTIPCETEDDCPAPSSGDAVVNCGAPGGQDTRCQLTCIDGETCPDGMECVPLGNMGFALCAWPS